MIVLFDNSPAIDLRALTAIAGRAMSLEDLRASGFVNLLKSSDLFHCGYSVSHWFKPSEPGVEILEFNPISGLRKRTEFPRLTAATYEEQRAIHEALGVRVVPPGKPFLA